MRNNFSNSNVRVLLQKGIETTRALLDFLWSLLHNPASYASGADKDILALLEQALREQRGRNLEMHMQLNALEIFRQP